MSDVVNVVVAVAVIFFVVRWATSVARETPEEQRIRSALGFRPKKVTQEMSDTIASMFPDMPRHASCVSSAFYSISMAIRFGIYRENIHYDLLRTGSVEQTTNKIIERGYLDPPPQGYFRIYPRADAQRGGPGRPASAASSRGNPNAQPQASSSSHSSFVKSGPSLIDRYQLQDRLSTPESHDGQGGPGVVFDAPEQAGGKASWEPTPERREASLRERKAQMVLAARKRLLEEQKAAEVASSSGAKAE